MEAVYKDLHSTVIKAKQDDGSVRFRLTERKIDRVGEVVMPMGIILDTFKTNPVVLFQHGNSQHGRVPIGKINVDTITQTKNFLDADVIFDDGESSKDVFAQMIAQKVRDGFLNAGSIGFMPIEISREAQFPKQTGPTFTKSELHEFSIAAIPMLPSALAKRQFEEVRAAVKENFGEDSLVDMDSWIDKFYNMEPQFDGGVGIIKSLQDDFKELQGRLVSMEDQIKQSNLRTTEGGIIISDATLKELESNIRRTKEIAEQIPSNSAD